MAPMLALIALLVPLQTASVTLAPDTEARWVPFELLPSNQIRFELTLDGRKARAILDTGVTDTLVTPAFAATAGIKPGARDRAIAPGGDVEIAWGRAGTLAFGGLERREGRVVIADAPILGQLDAEVILGSDVLVCCALEIDFDARRFRMLTSGRMPFTGATAPLRTRGSSPYTSEVVLAGKSLRAMLVDTGDGASVTLARPAWLSTGYGGSPVTTTLGWGMGGAVVTDTAVIPSLSLAGLPAREAEIRVEDAGGFSARAGLTGRIGLGLLARYRVLLDPRAGRMVLQPGKAIDAPVLKSTSGLLFRYETGALRVLHVMRGSPAEADGWKADDRICAADGTSIAQGVAADGAVGWAVGAPGRAVRLTLCDGTERTLTLRRFY
jgi:hypothetical protein